MFPAGASMRRDTTTGSPVVLVIRAPPSTTEHEVDFPPGRYTGGMTTPGRAGWLVPRAYMELLDATVRRRTMRRTAPQRRCCRPAPAMPPSVPGETGPARRRARPCGPPTWVNPGTQGFKIIPWPLLGLSRRPPTRPQAADGARVRQAAWWMTSLNSARVTRRGLASLCVTRSATGVPGSTNTPWFLT